MNSEDDSSIESPETSQTREELQEEIAKLEKKLQHVKAKLSAKKARDNGGSMVEVPKPATLHSHGDSFSFLSCHGIAY